MQASDRAVSIKMLALDVDGVLTDGGLYYHPDGSVSKRFHVQDGLGIRLAQEAGLEIVVASGLDSEAVVNRITKLGIKEYLLGQTEKVPFLEDVLQRRGWQWSELAYLGDDWVDLKVLNLVGLKMAVSNAQPEVKALAHWVSALGGGHGAVREAIRFILAAQGQWEEIWRRWAK